MKIVKRRYLLAAVDSQGTFSSEEFVDAVWSAVVRLYGEHGASKTNLGLIRYDIENRLAVLRTGHDSLEMVRAALASITRIRDESVAVHVLAVSGTLKALHKKTRAS